MQKLGEAAERAGDRGCCPDNASEHDRADDSANDAAYEAGNSQSLCQKLLEAEKSPKKINLGDLKDKYSYSRSASLITATINNCLNSAR